MNPYSIAWVLLVMAGLLEVVWAVALKESNGLRRPVPATLTVLGLAASLGLLAVAMKRLPVGTAYPVWVGIGALGTAVLGAMLHKEPVTLARVLCVLMLIGGVVGLKLTSTPEP